MPGEKLSLTVQRFARPHHSLTTKTSLFRKTGRSEQTSCSLNTSCAPVSFSATMMPRAANIAKRPLLISRFRHSSSYLAGAHNHKAAQLKMRGEMPNFARVGSLSELVRNAERISEVPGLTGKHVRVCVCVCVCVC